MLIHKTEKQVKEIAVVTEHYHVCDKCGKNLNDDLDDRFDAFDSTYKLREGQSFPEGEYGTITSMELCKSCTTEFIQLLKDNGYRLNEDEIDD